MAVLGTAPSAIAGSFDPLDQWLEMVTVYAPSRWNLSVDSMRAKCGDDLLCAARVVASLDRRARLQKISHPDTDTIRWVKTGPSVMAARRLDDGGVFIALERFGRKARQEMVKALDDLSATHKNDKIVLDLRKNSGGNFNNMLRVAGLFTGTVDNALFLNGGGKKTPIGIAAAKTPRITRPLVVLVGPETASSGEILAVVLRKYAGARLVGKRTYGKDYLLRIIPVNNEWRLMLPAERVIVPGETITGGVTPDQPILSGTFPGTIR